MVLHDRGHVRVVAANRASSQDLAAIFGTMGAAATCQCQRYKLAPRESFSSVPREDRADRLRDQTGCGHPLARATSGLVGYLDDQPVGWCAVEPRTAYVGLVRSMQVPWAGRSQDKSDERVWALTCLMVRPGYRRRGVSAALVVAAVDVARDHGARAIEGYPINTTEAISEELHVGTCSVFTAAGFTAVSAPTPRRVVMRIDF